MHLILYIIPHYQSGTISSFRKNCFYKPCCYKSCLKRDLLHFVEINNADVWFFFQIVVLRVEKKNRRPIYICQTPNWTAYDSDIHVASFRETYCGTFVEWVASIYDRIYCPCKLKDFCKLKQMFSVEVTCSTSTWCWLEHQIHEHHNANLMNIILQAN